MITYIIQATFCWAVLYALYAGLLSRADLFQPQPVLPVGKPAAGAGPLLVEWQLAVACRAAGTAGGDLIPHHYRDGEPEVIVTATAGEPGVSWWGNITAYWLGVGIAALRFALPLPQAVAPVPGSERRKAG